MAAAKTPPGPKEHFLFGSVAAYIRNPLQFLTGLARDHGDVVRFRLGRMPCYLFSHPAQIEEVLRVRHQDFIKDKLLQLSTPVFGRGLLTSEGDFWRQQRRLAQPAFLQQQVQSYGEFAVLSTLRMLDTWGDHQELDIHQELSRLTLGIVAKTLFNADLSGQENEVGEILRVLSDHFSVPFNFSLLGRWLPTRANRLFRRAVRRLDEITGGIIRQHQDKPGDPSHLLSRLMAAQGQDGGRMDARQLRDEVVTILLAGHETTALALTYGFYVLAQHPEVAERLEAELNGALAGRAPAAADLPRLRYAEWVIKETMRLYPPAWGIGREAVRDCEIGGYRVPRGSQVFLIQWVVHHDARWFPDPDVFRPERWDNDFERRLPRCAYFPFGDGPRTCVGNHFAMLETILILTTIAQRFRLSLVPDQTLELLPSITLRPKQGIKMIIQERDEPQSRVEAATERAATE